MTSLGCNAKCCTHNSDGCCCMDNIHVNGESAQKTEDTCCCNFQDSTFSSSNSVETPKAQVNVSCSVDSCKYYSNNACVADHINISGICACTSDDTVCASYVKK